MEGGWSVAMCFFCPQGTSNRWKDLLLALREQHGGNTETGLCFD